MESVLKIKGDLYVDELDTTFLHEDGIIINVENEVIALFGTKLPDGVSYIDLKKFKVKEIIAFANI